MFRKVAVAGLVLSMASAAFADFTPGVDSLIAGTSIYTLNGQLVVPGDWAQPHDPTGTTYGAFTGVATAAGGLTLLEPTAPPVRDDIVPFDGVADQINDYIAAAGGVNRTFSESITPLGGGVFGITITATGTAPAGGPGDLWPSGFVNGAQVPLTSGAFGIGLNLPASLGGADPLTWEPSPIVVNLATMRIATSGVFGAPIAIPLTFFGPSALNWNGVFAVSFGNGATGTGIQDIIELNMIVGKAPEPSSLALLVIGAASTLIRRRSRTAA